MPACGAARRLLLLWLLSLAVPASAFAAVFSVNNPTVDQIGNGHVLNARISYPLTPKVEEAVANGVPIIFYQEMELLHSFPLLGRFWQWNSTLWRSRLSYELRYHALSEQYVVLSLDTHDQRSFPSLQGALSALGHIENLSLPPEHSADADNLVLRIRSGIDLHSLPTPLRPGALISGDWQLTSPWAEAVWH